MWKKPKYDADGNRKPPNNWAAAWGGQFFRSSRVLEALKIIQEVRGSMMKLRMSIICIYSLQSSRI
jgi:hypothetical protein